MATEQQILAFLQTPGLSDQAIAAELNRIGATAQQVSNVTGVPVNQIQQRIAAVTPVVTTPPVTTPPVTTPTFTNPVEQQILNYLQTPGLTDAQIATELNRIGALPQQVSNVTGVPVSDVGSRMFTQYLQTPGLTDKQIAAEMVRLGVNPNQVAKITGLKEYEVANRQNAVLPFANAMQGFAPAPAAYTPADPNSPYAKIMGQMQPFTNPYASVEADQALGGYDPNLYTKILKDSQEAATRQRLASAGLITEVAGGAGGIGIGGGDSTGNAAASAAAAGSSAGATGGPGGVGIGEGGGTGMGGWAKGGLVDRVAGPNPPGPDDGAGMLDIGEYVIKKSSVDKYGKGLLDMINEGKIPAKQMKSLLG